MASETEEKPKEKTYDELREEIQKEANTEFQRDFADLTNGYGIPGKDSYTNNGLEVLAKNSQYGFFSTITNPEANDGNSTTDDKIYSVYNLVDKETISNNLWEDSNNNITKSESDISYDTSLISIHPKTLTPLATAQFLVGDTSPYSNPQCKTIIRNPPAIVIQEFKPSTNFTTNLLDAFKVGYNLGNSIKDLADAYASDPSKADSKLASDFKTDVISYFKQFLSYLSFRNGTQDNYGESMTDYLIALVLYRRVISGVYMNKYTLPLNSLKTYLESSNLGEWSGNIANNFGKSLQNVFSSIFNGFGLPKIVWNKGNGSLYPSITLSFNLFNRTKTDLYKNYRFINTLIPGSMWIQNGLIETPSTLYDVFIPGRTRLFFCAAKMSCTFEGKIRKVNFAFPQYTNLSELKTNISNEVSSIRTQADTINEEASASSGWSGIGDDVASLFGIGQSSADKRAESKQTEAYAKKMEALSANISTLANSAIKGEGTGIYTKSLNLDINSIFNNVATKYYINVPDIYKIDITLQSLLPNNLNTYLMGMLEVDPDAGANFAIPGYGLYSYARTPLQFASSLTNTLNKATSTFYDQKIKGVVGGTTPTQPATPSTTIDVGT